MHSQHLSLPGKSDDGFDRGRQLETGDESDGLLERPLRNVELTGPYMHAGTYEWGHRASHRSRSCIGELYRRALTKRFCR